MTGDRFYKLSMALASRADLTGSDKVVLAIIIDRMGHNGKCWPGTRTLARESGLHRETVLECIGRLEGCGDLVVDRAVGPLESESRQVLGGAEAARENQGIVDRRKHAVQSGLFFLQISQRPGGA